MTDTSYEFLSDEDVEQETKWTAEERKVRKEATRLLEEKFADRGLKFSTSFEGNIPVVAYGVLDGLPFYFRYRNDTGQLRLGLPDPKAELKRYIKRLESTLNEAKNALGNDGAAFRHNVSLREPDPARQYPMFIKKTAMYGEFLQKPYNAQLDLDEFVSLFSLLVESLENVDIDLTK